MSEATRPEDPQPWLTREPYRAIRWLLALALIVAGFLMLASGTFGCIETQEPAAVGEEAVAALCRAPSLIDPVVVLGLFAVIGLLFPDLSELSVGVISLKRTVAEDKAETDAKLERLDLRIGMTQNVNLYPSPTGSLNEHQVETKTREWVGAPGFDEREFEPTGESREVVESEFLRAWSVVESIQDWYDEAQRMYETAGSENNIVFSMDELAQRLPSLLGRSIPFSHLGQVKTFVGHGFNSLLPGELSVAKSARNLTVHGDQIDLGVLSALTAALREFAESVGRGVDAILSDPGHGT